MKGEIERENMVPMGIRLQSFQRYGFHQYYRYMTTYLSDDAINELREIVSRKTGLPIENHSRDEIIRFGEFLMYVVTTSLEISERSDCPPSKHPVHS